MKKFQSIGIGDLLAKSHSSRAEAVELLRGAADLVETMADDSASWRAVDALVILKSITQYPELPGIDSVTGRGGMVKIK